MPLSGTRTTCQGKLAALQLLEWLRTPASASFAQSNVVAVLDAQTLTGYTVPTFTCDNAALTVGSSTTNAIIAGSNALGSVLLTALSFYQTIDMSQTYNFITRDPLDSMAQVAAGEIGAAIVQPGILTLTNPTQYQAYAASGDFRILPAIITAAVPTFNLPTALSTLSSTSFVYPSILGNSSASGGILISLPTILQIFTGQVTQWSDTRITATLPWLSERIQYANKTNTPFNNQITLILCCSNSSADTSATQAFAFGVWSAMMRTPPVFRNQYLYQWFDLSATASGTFSWAPYMTTLTNLTNVVMVAAESQMVQALQAIPGSIGYKAYQNSTNDYTSEVKLTTFYLDAQGNIHTPTIPCTQQSMLECAYLSGNQTYPSDGVFGQSVINKLNNFSLQLTAPGQSGGCWPMSLVTSIVTLSHYDDDFIIPVSTANKTLNLVSWLLNNSLLTVATSTGGVARINALPQLQSAVMYSLQYITCNGDNCLITLPYIWTVGSGVTAFATAVSAIGITIVLLSYVVLVMCRRRTSLRAASVPFLLVINTGVLFLLIACILIVQHPSDGICQGFAWMTDMGLILAFGPVSHQLSSSTDLASLHRNPVLQRTNRQPSHFTSSHHTAALPQDVPYLPHLQPQAAQGHQTQQRQVVVLLGRFGGV